MIHRERMTCWLAVLSAALVVAVLAPTAHADAATTPYVGLVNLGMPATPQPFMPSDFAITKHLRNAPNFAPPASGGSAQLADHGPDCSAPPATHPIDGNYQDMVFVCHDHVMTAINSDDNGYGEIVMQPAQLVDFSNGATAHVSISVSTNKPQGQLRDWISFHFAPFNEQQAYLETIADGQADANNDLMVTNEFRQDLSFTAQETVNGTSTDIPGDNANVDALVTPSAVVRTPFDFYVSQTHLRVVVAGDTLFDAPLAQPLTYSQAVFQFIHHSYTPDKAGIPPVTWHWSNLSIDRAVPYFLAMGMPDAVGGDQATITFARPAPAGAHVRFQAYYDDVQVSFDQGVSWQNVNNVTGGYMWGHALNVWLPVPVKARSMSVRGNNGVGGGWYARDFYLMAPIGSLPPSPTPTSSPVNTPTPPPTPNPTATPVNTPTPVAINGVPCTVILNGVSQQGTCSGTFTPAH